MAELEYEAAPEDITDDMEEEEADEPQLNQPRVRSTVQAAGKKKGRGFRETGREEDLSNARFESLDPSGSSGAPARSVEGWVLFVTGLHEEAQEEDVTEAFAEYGDVKNVYLNLDRQTGYVKGYALVEYSKEDEARRAIKDLDGSELLTQTINVTWAFINKGGSRGGGGGRRGRR